LAGILDVACLRLKTLLPAAEVGLAVDDFVEAADVPLMSNQHTYGASELLGDEEGLRQETAPDRRGLPHLLVLLLSSSMPRMAMMSCSSL
jgi:hypothetical protein